MAKLEAFISKIKKLPKPLFILIVSVYFFLVAVGVIAVFTGMVFGFLNIYNTIKNSTIGDYYHSPSIVSCFPEVSISNNSTYCLSSNGEVYLLTGNTFEKVNIQKNDYYKSLCHNEDNIFILSGDTIHKYDLSNYSEISTISLNSFPCRLFNYQNKCYVVSKSVLSPKEHYPVMEICEISNDFASYSHVCDALVPGTKFIMNNKSFYLDYDFSVYSLTEQTSFVQLFLSSNTLSIYSGDTNSVFKITDSQFYCNNKEDSFNKEKSHLTVFSDNDDYYFSTYNRLADDKCQSQNCISRFGTGTFWRYNKATNELTEILKLPEYSFSIAIDKESIFYYYNGAIYKNGTKIQDFQTITPGEEYKTNLSYLDDKYVNNWNNFYYKNGNVYGLRIDNK